MIRIRPVPLTAVALLLILTWTSASMRSEEPPPKKELTAEQKEKLKERDKYSAEAKKLRAAGKLTEAVAAAEKILAIEREVFGDVHEEVAGTYDFIADLQGQREDFPAARKACEKRLEICLKLYGAESWKVTDARLALGDVDKVAGLDPNERRQLAEASSMMEKVNTLYGQAKYRDAGDLVRQALAINKTVLGDNHRHTAGCLAWVGVLLERQGDYAEARPYMEQSLAIKKQVLGENHPETAGSLNNLGFLLWKQGDYAGAPPYLEQALAIYKKVLGDNHPRIADCLNNVGFLLQVQGDYARARPYLEGALAIRKKVRGDTDLDTAESLNNLGGLLYDQGDYAGARAYFQQALVIYKELLGDKHPRTAVCLNNLGGLLRVQGDYTGALPYLKQSLAIRKKVLGDNHPDTAITLNTLALTLEAQENYAEARAYLEHALAIRKKVVGDSHADTAKSLSNLGSLLVRQADYAGARPYLEDALAIRKRVLSSNHPDMAASFSNLGALMLLQRDCGGARPYFEQALTISRNSLELAASALSERQQLEMNRNVRADLDAYLSVFSVGDIALGNGYIDVLSWKGAVQARQRQLRAARKNSELAPLVAKLQLVSQELANLAFRVPDPKQLADHRRRLAERTQKKEELERTLAGRSASFREGQSLSRLTPEQVQKLLPPRTVLIDLLEYRHFSPDAKTKGKLNKEDRLAAFVLAPSGPAGRVDLGPVKPIAEAVDAWRKDFGHRQNGKMGAAEETLRRLVWAPLEPHLKDATTVLVSPDGALTRFPFAALPGKEPGKYLIEEMAIAVVPVPKLLPELLKTNEATLGPSGGLEEEDSRPSLLLVGDVDYGADPGLRVAAAWSAASKERGGALGKSRPLTGTREEIGAIQDSFKKRFPDARVSVLSKAEATENEVRKQAPKHRYVHLATHGFFAPKELKSALAMTSGGDRPEDLFTHQGVSGWNPGLLSGIVLAGANQPREPSRDDGILTALEVAELDLDKVELAVLSACETGLGETAGGEGLLGLQRAFQVAGAKSVVASLWKVSDQGTQLFMSRFYKNLWDKKMPKLEALREAQLWMLREVPKQPELLRGLTRGGSLQFVDEDIQKQGRLPPYYWAAFVLSGDWR